MPEHANIYAAVAGAMADVKRLAKSERNADQKYDFASVDDFLAMCGPVCAAHGLVTVMDEEAVEPFERAGKYGPTYWLQVRFNITTFHASGQSLPGVKRTVEVIRTGAQSFGSAQSYALKQYLRALLLIPTGDADDPDFQKHGEGAPVKTEQTNHGAAIRDAWQQSVLDGLPPNATDADKAQAFADAIVADFNARTGVKALDNAWSRHQRLIEGLKRYPGAWERVVDAFETRKNEITPSESERIPA